MHTTCPACQSDMTSQEASDHETHESLVWWECGSCHHEWVEERWADDIDRELTPEFQALGRDDEILHELREELPDEDWGEDDEPDFEAPDEPSLDELPEELPEEAEDEFARR